jgi:hypothetical protein
MKRIIAVILALTLCLCLAACSKGGSGEKEESKNKDINAIYTQIYELVKDNDAIELKAERIPELYGIDATDIKAAKGVSFTITDAAFPGEAIIIEAPSKTAAYKVATALQQHRTDILNQSESYDKISHSIALESNIITEGNYVAFFFSDQHAEMEEIFNK